jgi:hypothetical protein
MPITLDDPTRPLGPPPPLEAEGDGIAGRELPPDRFPRRPRLPVADAVRRALRPRGTRGKTPFELGSRSR